MTCCQEIKNSITQDLILLFKAERNLCAPRQDIKIPQDKKKDFNIQDKETSCSQAKPPRILKSFRNFEYCFSGKVE